jgi:predicted MPP superfamily phosphohydrolase
MTSRILVYLCLISVLILLLYSKITAYVYYSFKPLRSVDIYGDSGNDDTTHRRIVASIMEDSPEVVFHAGDLVDKATSVADWKLFNQITGPLRERAKFYPAIGDHDFYSHLFFDNFQLPNNEKWYSVNWNGIHFIVLDTKADTRQGSEQYVWLENNLKDARSKTDFIVVIMHHPPFSEGRYNDYLHLRETVVTLFEKYGVDVVFSGHDHNYQRAFHGGVYYIVTGGGGSGLYDQQRDVPYTQVFDEDYNYCRLSVSDRELTVEAIDVDTLSKTLLDKFVVIARK